MIDTGILQPEPDFSHVHLQWFADGEEAEGNEAEEQDGEVNVDDKITELEKTLKNLQKDLKGKDRAIGRLMDEKKSLEERTNKSKEREKRRIDLDSLTKEELAREIERREDEIKSEYERELNEIREKTKQNEYVQTVYRIAPEIENLPPFIIKLLVAGRDPDEDKIRDAMIDAKKSIDTLINKNRLVLDNRSRTAHQPQSGATSTSRIPTKTEWAKMNEAAQREWAHYASNDDLEKVNHY